MRKIIFALVLGFASLALMPVPAHATGCPSSTWSSLYPQQCILDYSDEATSIGSSAYKLQPDIDSCADYFSGIKLSTGYDYVSYVRFADVSGSGELKKGKVGKIEVYVAESCRAWSKSYLLSGVLKFADGTSVPISLPETNFTYREKFTGSVDSYCFTNICGRAYFSGNYSIPDKASGSAVFVLTGSYNQASTSTSFGSINFTYNYSGFLFTGASSTPAPSPTSTASPTESSNSTNPLLDTPDFTLSFVNTTITAVISGSDAAAYLQRNGSFEIRSRLIDSKGVVHLGLSSPNPTNGQAIVINWNGVTPGIWQLQIVTSNSAGESPWSLPKLIVVPSPAPSSSASSNKQTNTLPKKTIVCIKKNVTKKVTGVNPKCPAGYKKK